MDDPLGPLDNLLFFAFLFVAIFAFLANRE